MTLLTERQIVWIEAKIEKYNRKANRLKQEALTLIVGAKYDLRQEMSTWVDYPFTYEQIMEYPESTISFTNKQGISIWQDLDKLRAPKWECEILGAIPKVKDWKVIGKIERGPEGFNFTSAAPGVELPAEYKDCALNCDHCKYDRRRNKTVILEKDGKTIQVGSSCLADFLGDGNAEQLAELALVWADFSSSCPEDDEEGYYHSPKWRGFDLHSYVAICIAFTKKKGYTSRANSNEFHPATSTLATCEYFQRNVRDKSFPILPVEVLAEAETVVKFFQDMPESVARKNDFTWNLWLLAKSGFIPGNKAGYAAYMHQYWLKEMNQQPKYLPKNEKVNEFFGEIGKKISVNVKLVSINYVNSAWGCSTLYKFKTNEGLLFGWFSSSKLSELEGNQGKEFVLSGTVKAHNVFNDRKETLLKRCKVKEVEVENVSSGELCSR